MYRRTWRHPYVPCYYPELGAGPLVNAADERARARWLAAVNLLVPVVNLGQNGLGRTSGASAWIASGLTTMGWLLLSTATAGITRILTRR